MGVQPNGKEIRRLRERRGWSQEQLAYHATCSQRTILRCENDGGVRASTLALIANALKVEVPVILIDGPPALMEDNRVTGEMEFATPITKADEAARVDRILVAVRRIAAKENEIDVVGVNLEKGSILIAIDIKDAHDFISAWTVYRENLHSFESEIAQNASTKQPRDKGTVGRVARQDSWRQWVNNVKIIKEMIDRGDGVTVFKLPVVPHHTLLWKGKEVRLLDSTK